MKRYAIGWVAVTAAAIVAVSGARMQAQKLLGSYRGAAKAYRDAADKASADRRPCYLEWAAYYEGYATALERNGNPPTEPALDPSCLGRGGSGARRTVTPAGASAAT